MAPANHMLAFMTVVSLVGCAAPADRPSLGIPDVNETCPVLKSRDWQARLERAPGLDEQRILSISGVVDLPTPGYTATLEAGPADRAMPPSQRFRLKAVPPSGMAAQVVTSSTVTYREPATYPAYRSIVILCGERALATIDDVPTQ